MKFTYQISLLLLGVATTTLALPQLDASPDEEVEEVETDVAPHNAEGAAVINPSGNVAAVEKVAAAGKKKCMTFTSDNPNWHYANTGVWGNEKGTFGKGPKKICVPHNDGAGGAMFIGTEANPQGGNTKLECYYPSAGTANCDISLVDGYSLSVTCQVPGHKVGGARNLFKTGKKCFAGDALNRGICLNKKGYAPKQSDVTPFFQQAIKGGNHYCIWVNCSQDYFFPVGGDVKCHVSGGR